MEPETNTSESTRTATGHLMQQLLRKVALLESKNSELELELELERQVNGQLRLQLSAAG